MNLSNWDQVRFTTWGGASGKKNSRITPMRIKLVTCAFMGGDMYE